MRPAPAHAEVGGLLRRSGAHHPESAGLPGADQECSVPAATEGDRAALPLDRPGDLGRILLSDPGGGVSALSGSIAERALLVRGVRLATPVNTVRPEQS